MIPMGNARGGGGQGRNFRTIHSKSSTVTPSISSSISSTSSSKVEEKLDSKSQELNEKKEENESKNQNLEKISVPSLESKEDNQRKDQKNESLSSMDSLSPSVGVVDEMDDWSSLLIVNKEKEEEKLKKEREKREEDTKRKNEEEKKKREEEIHQWKASQFAKELCVREEGFLKWKERFGREFLMKHYGNQGEKHIYLPVFQSSSIVPFDFSSPSPDDLVFLARKQSFKQKKVEKKGKKNEEEEMEEEVNQQETPDTISFSDTSAVPSTTQKIIKKKKKISNKEEGRNESETLSFKTEYSKSTPSISKPLPMKQYVQMSQQRRREVEKWRIELEKEEKQNFAVGIIGQFNSGKSTLLGHLSFLSGLISQQLMHKGDRDAKLNGKPSYLYAYLLDELEEERKRWMTMDCNSIHLETQKFKLQMVDTPGYVDFIPNAITACSQVDSVIIVIDSSPDLFEAEFEPFGQTKELISIVRSFGISQIGVVVNKMSSHDWSQQRYEEIVSKVGAYLKQSGMRESNYWFVPTDAFTGENLISQKEDKLKSWYSGPTLQQQIDVKFQRSEKEYPKPLRICLADLYKSPAMGGFTIIGKMETGLLSIGDKLLVCPQNQVATVKTIKRGDTTSDFAQAGDLVHVGLQGVDASTVGIGSILCDPEKIIEPCYKINAQILTFVIDCPILPGQIVEFHYLCLNEAAIITKIVSTLERVESRWERRNEKPRMLKSQSNALIEIQFLRPICLELSSTCKPLGRFVLRWNEKSIAAGIVTEIDRKFQPENTENA
eukprot:TRINITY_DN3225_c0_g1_i2.p1 TRINITY_DN3225_c0_g1~~TRINITY_DN3225_c0_g1_i2.p1  ORF type:complete len:777 (+),score=310.53 TRINITY_DN3225_c0_g1_i2:52-2382(+)